MEIKQSLRINVFSIQHQNYNGRWHNLANSRAKNVNCVGYQTELFRPTNYLKSYEKFRI